MAYYAGNSDKLSSFGLYGLDPNVGSNTDVKLTAAAYSQLIWYFLHGFSHRRGDFPVSATGMTEYLVDIDDFDGYAYKQQYNIRVLPSMLIFNSKGEIVARYQESLPPTRLLKLLAELNSTANRQITAPRPPQPIRQSAPAPATSMASPDLLITPTPSIQPDARPSNYSRPVITRPPA